MTTRQSLSPMRKLAIFEAAGGVCHLCERKIIVGERWDVEHPRALGLLGVDDDTNRRPAHEDCHDIKTKDDVSRIAKAKRQKAKHLGIRKRSTFPCGRNSPWKRKVSGGTVRR